MANRYISEIDGQAPFFKHYLRESLGHEACILLENIAAITDVYIFSGIIRNFFLGEPYYRDLDIVVKDCSEITKLLEYNDNIYITRNHFGGLKIKVGRFMIDLWSLDQTWGIKKQGLDDSPQSLLKTVFFNFSAIVFDFNKTRFYYGTDFVRFFNTRQMDVVYDSNPNIPLCIVNTCYYYKKYGLGVGLRLCLWVFINYISIEKMGHDRKELFDKVQMGHFGKVNIEYIVLKDFVLSCYQHFKSRRPISPCC